MPDRLSARAALAVLLLLLTIAGIGAAGPAVGLHLPARPVVLGIGAALEAALAGLLFTLRWRARPVAGVGARLRPLLAGALVTGLIAVPSAALIAIISKIHSRRPIPPALLRPRAHPAKTHLGRTAHGTISLVALQNVLVALLVAAIIVAAIVIWRRRRGWARRHRFDVPADEETGTPAELARAVDSGDLPCANSTTRGPRSSAATLPWRNPWPGRAPRDGSPRHRTNSSPGPSRAAWLMALRRLG